MVTQTTASLAEPAVPNARTERKFSTIKMAVADHFHDLSTHVLFRTTVSGDDLWRLYLESFPAGTNPTFRERTEHDCSCCRNFIRSIGNVVAIVDGNLVSMWDVQVNDAAYQAVCDALSAAVKRHPIDNLFLTPDEQIGTDRNFEDGIDGVVTWEHFSVDIPNYRGAGRSFVYPKDEIGPRLSEARAQHDVLLRSLTELTASSVDTALKLIAQNSLYRGEEHRHSLTAFKQTKAIFDTLPEEARDVFVWGKITELHGAVSKIRNTSIGTLLVDLSGGRDLEQAVSAYERLVAPMNYKRPTALVTPAMIDKAKDAIAGLGLLSALDRRYATSADVTINNVLFADRTVTKALTGGTVFDDLAGSIKTKPRAYDKVEEVGIERFIDQVLPQIDKLEVLVENRHTGNFVSLIAPEDPAVGRLFKWDNGFSWSYNGDFADSIKERVKRAGGNIAAELCCRLGWYNFDDLDLHMMEPSGNRIYYANKGPHRPGFAQLDVDMNVGGSLSREPVENIFYPTIARMLPGAYRLFVNEFNKREPTDIGFEVEIDVLGTVHRFAYDKPMVLGQVVEVATITKSPDGTVTVDGKLTSSTASKKVWNLQTETFQKVRIAMLSPNYWDGQGVGNKHYFFLLDGCKNDGSARGFYNEFLRSDLDPHRKVFEIVGSKIRAEDSTDQLSGLGFSSTQRNNITVRVSGAMTRVLRVVF